MAETLGTEETFVGGLYGVFFRKGGSFRVEK